MRRANLLGLAVKNNLGPKASGIGYRMEQRIVSKGIIGSHIVCDSAPVTVTADEALRQANANGGGKTGEAKELSGRSKATVP